MSLNHILKETVPDDEKLDVKFGIVECDEIEVNGDPLVGPEPINPANTQVVPGATAGITGLNVASFGCLKLGRSVITGWSFWFVMPATALAEFDIDAPYPDALQTFYASDPTAVSAFTTTGYASITAVTVDLKGHQFLLVSSVPTPGSETTKCRLTFRSIGNVPATTGSFNVFGKVSHSTAPFV
jgi:hypothetical protein